MTKFCYFYYRNEDTIELSEAEALHITKGEIVAHGVIVCEKSCDWQRSAFIRGGGQLVASGKNLDELCAQLRELSFSAENFKIVSEPIPRLRKGDHHAIIQVADAIKGPVDLKNPNVVFILIISDEGCWLIESDEPTEQVWTTFKYKPFAFCNALPIKIARAMINLTANQGDSVLDPCCGSGTIPLMVAELGFTAMGGDKSWPNLNISRKNIAHFGFEAELLQEDATETKRSADCIITNLPYGLYLPISEDILIGMLNNFRTLTKKVSIVTTDDISEKLVDCGYRVKQHLESRSNNLVRYIFLTEVI